MSGKLVIQVIRTARAEQERTDRALSQSSRLLTLLILADAANKAGICWPSQNALAQLTRLSVRTISEALADLKKDGHITVNPRPGHNVVFTVHPCNHCSTTPATIAGVSPKSPTPLQPLQHPLQPLQDTPATIADEPYKEPNKKPGARSGFVNGQRAPKATDATISAEEFARMREDPVAYWAAQEAAGDQASGAS